MRENYAYEEYNLTEVGNCTQSIQQTPLSAEAPAHTKHHSGTYQSDVHVSALKSTVS